MKITINWVVAALRLSAIYPQLLGIQFSQIETLMWHIDRYTQMMCLCG